MWVPRHRFLKAEAFPRTGSKSAPDGGAVVRPVPAVDARGAVHLALALAQDGWSGSLVMYRSEDGGTHWSAPAVILQGGAECGYAMTADIRPESSFRGHVYLAADMDDALCFARSIDGVSWNGGPYSKPGPLIPGVCCKPEVHVDAHGGVWIAWLSGAAHSRIVLVHSADGGNTFGEPVTIAEGITGAQNGLAVTALTFSTTRDGVAICVWTDNREKRSRLYWRRSLDHGRTWQGPVGGEPLVPLGTSGQNEFQPHLIAAAGGEICCAFYEYGPKTPGGPMLVELTMAVSYDRGATFAHRMVLSQQPWRLAQ